MLGNAWAALRPGGLLCVRDHGLCDMVGQEGSLPTAAKWGKGSGPLLLSLVFDWLKAW
jgi:hypothetical protein